MSRFSLYAATLTLGLGAALALPAHADTDIPVTRVVMSTSGLAYFEHKAEVSGGESLSFPVRLDQVNDLLKSLLVFDPKGQLKSVRLPGKEPLEQAFRDLPFSRTQLNNPIALLKAYQGAMVEVEESGTKITGKLMSITAFDEAADEVTVKRHRVTILAKDGMRQVVLENTSSIKLVDDKATRDIQTALDAVRENGESEQRRLSIDLTGKDKRDVSLSYVVSAPLWKTSYRLVLPKDGDEKGYLQGWAIIENMTGGDWDNVKLTLTSGNPVTLQQNLYPSYYVDRPSIPVEVFGRVMPRLDTGAVAMKKEKMAERKQAKNSQFSSLNKALGARRANAAPMAMGMAMGGADMDMALEESAVASFAPSLDTMSQGENAAMSGDTTAQVIFEFPAGFNLDSGQSMMLPFVNRELPMKAVALYQPDRHGSHPFLSVSVDNSADSSLPPGILTLYEDGKSGMRFVGDAQLAMLPKSDTRMVSYALDHKTKITREYKNNQVRGTLSASEGVLYTKVNYINTTEYTIAAPAEENRTVMIEHPKMPGYDLTGDIEGIEKTDNYYRISVPVKAGETVKKSVSLSRTGSESASLVNMSMHTIQSFIARNSKLDAKTKKIFAELAKLKQAEHNAQQTVHDLEQKKQRIYNDQERIRNNMRSLSGNSKLKDRYMEQLNDQEDKLEDLLDDLEDAQNDAREHREELEKFVRTIKF